MNTTHLKRSGIALGLLSILALSACAEKQEILPGKREGVRAVLSDQPSTEPKRQTENRKAPIRLGAVRTNASWSQAHGSVATRNTHPAYTGSMQMVWSAGIGAGDSRKGRITADPVVAGGRIFTLDAAATVTATGTNGATLWTRDLSPENDRDNEATGGGLAHAGKFVFVTSGFGRVTALEASTGNVVWQQKLQAAATGAPAVHGGIVYLVAGDSTAWALDAATGRIRWQTDSVPDANNILGAPTPAVSAKSVVFAFGSGEVQGVETGTGLPSWASMISGERKYFSRGFVSDVTGDPVVSGNRVFVGTQSGRLAALDLTTGERIWTASEGALGPIWVAGGSLFFVSDRNELLRLSAADGSRVWGTKLPFFVKDKPRKQRSIFAHHGPVIAGGRVIVASDDGLIRAFDPVSGALVSTGEIPGGATTNPVFAGGRMYVVGTKGQLFAFR